MAERAGFEPAVRVIPVRRFSKPVLSTTQPSLRTERRGDNELGFEARHSIRDAVEDLRDAFEQGKLSNSLNDAKYFNIDRMKSIDIH